MKNRLDQNFAKYKLAEYNSGNKRWFSSYVRSKMKSRATVGPSKVNGNVISDIKEMSAVHNKYFTSLFTKEMAGPVPETVTLPSLTSISNMLFSEVK